jgi:Protein of unknown function (DUF3025)
MIEAFDARFLEHPAFSTFDPEVRLRLGSRDHFPRPSELCELMLDVPCSSPPWFDFEPEDDRSVREAGGFDAFIASSARIPVRCGSYHDLLGALIWLHFPLMKRAIHDIQLTNPSGPRSARQNAATHLDESGVLVLSSDPAVFAGLSALEWSEVLWQRRAALLETTRFLCFGHGLLDGLRVPHPRLMSMALFARVSPRRLTLTAPELRVFVDRELSRSLPGFLLEPRRLQPLPVLGVPGWSSEQCAEFYQNEHYSRRARQRLRSAPAAAFVDLG